MAWFGEGFSSLKGQITNLTKDIVGTNVVGLGSQDSTEIATLHNEDTESSHLDRLKTQCQIQDEEILKLREDNERLRKHLARQTPRDRRVSEEATLECEEVSATGAHLPLVPLDEAGTDSFLGQDHVPKDVKVEEEISSLRSRLRKTFQEKVLMEQSCSRLEKEVALLTQQVNEDRQQAQADVGARRKTEADFKDCHQSAQTEIDSFISQTTASPDVAVLLQENDRLEQEKTQLRAELARMSRAVQDLESQVAVSQDENANLSTGMEELDIQHQEAIEQIMVLKDSTQKRYEVLLAEFEDMKHKYQEKVNLFECRNQDKSSKHVECQTKPDVPCEVKSQILLNLSEEIKNTITTEIPDKYFETSKENASGLETLAAVEKMLSHTMARVESSEGKIRDLLKELRNRDDEVQELEEENKTMQMKIDELRDQCENLPTIVENNEDVEGMENKISSLENEISILREVRSNLEVEHNNSRGEIESLIRQLQTAEAMIRNQDNLQTEISRYKKSEEELMGKISDIECTKEKMLSEISRLQQIVSSQEEHAIDLEQIKMTEKEFMDLNNQLQLELRRSKENELLYFKTLEELEKEKSFRAKVQDEKEQLISELEMLTNSEKNYEEQRIELQKEQHFRSQLEEENAELHQRLSLLQDIEKEHINLIKNLQNESNIKKELEGSLNGMFTEVKRLEREAETNKHSLEKQTLESDLKVKELKALNSCLTQKCQKFEKEMFDLSEKCDGLKIDIDSKGRKLCEMILEKSVSDQELAAIQFERDDMAKQLVELKTQCSSKEESLFQQLKDVLEKLLGSSDTIPIGSIRSISDFYSCINEMVNKFVNLEQEKNQLISENVTLSENIKSLISEVSDKTDCLLKLTAQIDTLQAEKHSIEDRLRNLNDTVSTSAQTDQPEPSQEYEEINKKLEECESKYFELEDRYQKLISSSDKSLSHVNDQLRNLHYERQQLIEAVQTKHTECVKYHSEIQRLCAELIKVEQHKAEQSAKLEKQLEEKEEKLTVQQANSDRKVAALTEQIHTLQNQLDYVSQLLRVTDRQEAEGQPSSDSTSVKTSGRIELEEKETRRVDELYELLQQEQLRNKFLQDEVSEQHEKEANLVRELERLRSHLVLEEENYTQEIVRAEQQVQELNLRLAVAEERAKSSSTAYTSASIRANQQVESFSSQMRLLLEQKEKLSTQLAAAEDKLHKQAAALTNLQIVLEQFQRDKERDVALENERIRQTLNHANNKNTELSNELKALQLQLKEAKEGLNAASRLTEQLDHKSQTIVELKLEVSELTDKLKKAEERVQAASVSVEGKVDRCLVRNLVVGFLCAPPSSRQQALSIIATVLDFTEEDRQKIGLDPNAKYNGLKQQSLSEAFIRFLENESRPQPQLRLPLQDSEGSTGRKTSFSEIGLPPARRTSGSVLKDVLKQNI